MLHESETKKSEVFISSFKERCGDTFTLLERINSKSDDPQDDDGTFDLPFDEVAPEITEDYITDAEGQPLHPSSVADILMNSEVLLPQGEDMWLEKVIRRNIDSDDKVTGDYNNIPTFNTIFYDVHFPDGAIKPYSANLIAENILMQFNADRYHRQSLEGILDNSSDNRAVEKKKKRIVSKRGRRSMRQTTVGWELRVK